MKLSENPILLIVLIIWIGFLFGGCEDTLNIRDINEETPKLVLYGRLCPQFGSTCIVLSHSKLMYGPGRNEYIHIIPDGIVELSCDGEHWVTGVFDNNRKKYVFHKQDFPIEEGKTYFVRASYPGYEGITASCTVPYSYEADCHFDTIVVEHDIHDGVVSNNPHRDVFMQWRDDPTSENYYAIAYYGMVGEGPSEFWFREWTLESLSDGETWLQTFSDEGRNGQTIRLLKDKLLPLEDDGVDNGSYYLLFLDKNCYLYENTWTDSQDYLNSLLLEPLHTYNNIQNGYGLFGAFCMKKVSR